MQTQNARLKNMIKLSHRVTVYCPTQDDQGNDVPLADEIVNETLTILSLHCGGATSTPAMGCWLTGNGQLIKENVTLVFAFCDKLDTALVDVLIDHAQHVKETLSQESVAIEIDGELYII